MTSFRSHTCAFLDCTSQKRKEAAASIEGFILSWHCLPPVKYYVRIRNKWIDIIRKARHDDKWQPRNPTFVCSRHFDPKLISRFLNSSRLLKDAVPTLFIGDGQFTVLLNANYNIPQLNLIIAEVKTEETSPHIPSNKDHYSLTTDSPIDAIRPNSAHEMLRRITNPNDEKIETPEHNQDLITNIINSSRKAKSSRWMKREPSYCLLCLKKSGYDDMCVSLLPTSSKKKFIISSSDKEIYSEWKIPKDQTHLRFLLQKLLDIPENTCNIFIQPNPLSTVYCCEYCSVVVKSARTLCEEMASLEERYLKLKTEVKNIIVNSVKSQEVFDNGLLGSVRSFVLKKFTGYCDTSCDQIPEAETIIPDHLFSETESVLNDNDDDKRTVEADTNEQTSVLLQGNSGFSKYSGIKKRPEVYRKVSPVKHPNQIQYRSKSVQESVSCSPTCAIVIPAKNTNIAIGQYNVETELVELPEVKIEAFEYEDVSDSDPLTLTNECTNFVSVSLSPSMEDSSFHLDRRIESRASDLESSPGPVRPSQKLKTYSKKRRLL